MIAMIKILRVILSGARKTKGGPLESVPSVKAVNALKVANGKAAAAAQIFAQAQKELEIAMLEMKICTLA